MAKRMVIDTVRLTLKARRGSLAGLGVVAAWLPIGFYSTYGPHMPVNKAQRAPPYQLRCFAASHRGCLWLEHKGHVWECLENCGAWPAEADGEAARAPPEARGAEQGLPRGCRARFLKLLRMGKGAEGRGPHRDWYSGTVGVAPGGKCLGSVPMTGLWRCGHSFFQHLSWRRWAGESHDPIPCVWMLSPQGVFISPGSWPSKMLITLLGLVLCRAEMQYWKWNEWGMWRKLL